MIWIKRQHISLGPAVVGLIALFVAFVSPLCAFTSALFTARAIHHVVILTLAAPALAIAMPVVRIGTVSLWLAAVTAVMVAWHIPSIYSWIWQSAIAYWSMQAAMLGSAWAFWSMALAAPERTEQIIYNAFGIAGLAGIMGLVGAVLTFSSSILYFEHVDGAALWGLAPIADQQLAGLVMWVPGFVPVATLAAVMLRRSWMRGIEA
ncbi:cytochrome c oxidase assembly protein [Paracoccus sp. JM45]|uniref:cytochrome c oxidase assembly protein n=1 Tax=Paracoccus sp. JM45 TaxID=2283626 RepID=UPI000E6C65C0|nr:cytochrome c oxidase assembly protein [Paracoccus sp. JM45]RJE78938.1 cytochrome c oxidase assembly protein [Paracoccus sp. JM45]